MRSFRMFCPKPMARLKDLRVASSNAKFLRMSSSNAAEEKNVAMHANKWKMCLYQDNLR